MHNEDMNARGLLAASPAEYIACLALVRKLAAGLARVPAGEGIVLAVSGGPDSIALWRAVEELRPSGRLVIAHLNHRLRCSESDADECFVRAQFKAISGARAERQLASGAKDVARLAQTGRDNLENAARRVRYAWLDDVARQTSCRWVATGHTADDQAETVLHRIQRGCGLRGLRGIAPERPLSSNTRLLRPMLAIRRQEVLAYLESRAQPYRVDSSNRDLRRTRNRIRRLLLPRLAEHDQTIVATLCQLAHEAAAAFDAEVADAERDLRGVELPQAGKIVVLNRTLLAAWSPKRVRQVLRALWAREDWPGAGMTLAHWERLGALVQGKTSALELPGHIQARRTERVVQLEKRL